jgi:hypothetical protein
MKAIMVLLALGLLALPAFAVDANTSDNTTSNMTANVTDNSTINVTDDSAMGGTSNGSAGTDGGLNLTDTAGLMASCTGNESASVGALPGDFTYGFKRFFENMDKFFTFSPSDAAVKHAMYGHERAVEAHLLACRAHDQQQAGNLTQANETMRQMQQLVADEGKEMNDSDADLEKAISQGSATNTTIDKVDNYTRNSIAVLQSVYERAPESAKDGILNALNNSIQNYQKHQEKVHGKPGDDGSGNATGDGQPLMNQTRNESGNGHGDSNVTGGHEGNNYSWNGTAGQDHGRGVSSDDSGGAAGGVGMNSTPGGNPSGAKGGPHGGDE